MKNFIMKGIAFLPVVGEILFVAVLIDELATRIKSRKSQHTTETPADEKPADDKK